MSRPSSEEKLVDDFIRLLEFRQTEPDRFTSLHVHPYTRHLYGGQAVAQAMRAAEMTTDGRPLHSLHAYFLRGGDGAQPVDYAVTRAFDGRAVCNRQVIAAQNGEHRLTLSASFHAGGAGVRHQTPLPAVTMPEDLADEAEVLASTGHPIHDLILRSIETRPFDVRMPLSMRKLELRTAGEPYYIWFRARAPMSDNASHHRALIAYVSDYPLLLTSMLPHGLVFFWGEATGMSIDHAMWFHAPARADEWLLYVTDSPWAGHGRGFSRGGIYTRDGTLAVSVAQEGLVRAT